MQTLVRDLGSSYNRYGAHYFCPSKGLRLLPFDADWKAATER
jgi:hypothetical protein